MVSEPSVAIQRCELKCDSEELTLYRDSLKEDGKNTKESWPTNSFPYEAGDDNCLDWGDPHEMKNGGDKVKAVNIIGEQIHYLTSRSLSLGWFT